MYCHFRLFGIDGRLEYTIRPHASCFHCFLALKKLLESLSVLKPFNDCIYSDFTMKAVLDLVRTSLESDSHNFLALPVSLERMPLHRKTLYLRHFVQLSPARARLSFRLLPSIPQTRQGQCLSWRWRPKI